MKSSRIDGQDIVASMRRLLFGMLIGCGGASTPPTPPGATLPPAPDSGVMVQQEELAPIPYTAEQTHAGCPAGRVISFRIEMPGKPPVVHVLRFLTSTDDGADIESSDRDEKGNA